MEIRRLKVNDSALLHAMVQKLASEEGYDGAASKDQLRRALAQDNCYCILCLDGSEPLGYLYAFRFPDLERDADLVYVYDLFVDEEVRRMGLASGMIEELKRWCERDGVHLVWLGTDIDNVPAQKTFEKTGATKTEKPYLEYFYSLKKSESSRDQDLGDRD